MTMTQVGFVAFGLISQVLLVAFFASRRWWPRRADVVGKAAYSFAALGYPLAAWFVLDGGTGFLFLGPLLIAIWATFGAAVDLWRPRPWREPPIEWNVLTIYVGLYFFAQMFLWWPLWSFARAAWVAFLVLFVANTGLNIEGHRRPGSHLPVRH